MNRTVFIPTDFSQASLRLVEHTLLSAINDQIEIVLTHSMFLSNSIVELLFFDKDVIFQSLRSDQFDKTFMALCDCYSQVEAEFRWEIFTGLNQAAFNNFISGNQINEAVIPRPYFRISRKSANFDPTPYVRRSKLPITEIPFYSYLLA